MTQDYKKYQKYAEDPSSLGDLDKLLAAAGGDGVAKTLMYDAITMCSQDGYSAKEKALAKKAASALGLSASSLSAIETLVANESALHGAKKALLWGEDQESKPSTKRGAKAATSDVAAPASKKRRK